MTVSTTWFDIRDNYITKIKALSPTLLSNLPFDQCDTRYELRDFASKAGSAGLRKFEFDRIGPVQDAPFFDFSVKETNEGMRLTVAYPTMRALYGRNDLNEMDKVLRSDARQLRDLIFSGGNYLAGQSAGFVTIQEVDKSNPDCWFSLIDVQLIYTEAQTLT